MKLPLLQFQYPRVQHTAKFIVRTYMHTEMITLNASVKKLSAFFHRKMRYKAPLMKSLSSSIYVISFLFPLLLKAHNIRNCK